MITHFNIPPGACINVPITKKQFAEKTALSSMEKRILREDVERITMKGLLQTRTTGIASYNDSDYNYDQIIFAEVDIRDQGKTALISAMMQKAFPAPLFLILHCGGAYCVNGCVKRINQSDSSKRVIEDMQTTRYFSLNNDDKIVSDWLQSLDSTKIICSNLKEWFDALSSKLLMLQVSDETGTFVQADVYSIMDYKELLGQLEENREEQRHLLTEIKAETQFNRIIKLNSKLKELQIREQELKKRIK
ncbi:MAG: DUF4391 domain-containing protein [Bacteroidaceae bacterium]|nr:DUF4391 domain-containing protein [Bacteroidaceae bacterium]